MRKLKLPSGISVLVAAVAVLAGCGGNAPLTPHQKSVHKAAIVGGLATPTQTSYGGRTHSQAFLQSVVSPRAGTLPSSPTATPQLPGYDAVTASAIPFKAQVALCYVDGRFANCTAVKARQPQHLVTIAVNTSGVARLLDDEPGDATPSEAGPWVKRMIQQYHIWRPGVYASTSNMIAVEQSLSSAGLARSQYVLMVASWDGNPAVSGGFDAKQWRSDPSLDFDSFLTSFFQPSSPPRTICWGKNSTPTSSECKGIELRAHEAWRRYLAFHRGQAHHQAQLNKLNGVLASLEKDKASVHQNYTGPGSAYIAVELKKSIFWADREKALHRRYVVGH